MRSIWAWLGLNLGKRAGVVSLVGLILTLGLGYGITRLEFETGQDSYLNQDDQVRIDNEAYQDLFGGQAMITLYTVDDGSDMADLFTPGNIARLRALEEDLRSVENVFNVVSPLTALQFTHNLVESDTGDVTQSVAGQALLSARQREEPGSEEAAARLEESLTTLQRVEAIPAGERTFDNPDWIEFLLHDNRGEIRKSLRPFFPDEQHAQIITRLGGNLSLEDEGLAAEAVEELTSRPEAELDNATTVTTGAPLLLKELNDYLRGGLLTLGGIAVAIMALILVLLFDVRWRLLPLAVILVGVVWAFGMAGFLGIPLSVVTIAGMPVMVGIGIDYAIQMHSRVEEEVLLDRAAHPIQETTSRLGPALLTVMLVAVLAFLALRFAQVPMIRDFGLLLAVGSVMIWLCGVTLPPMVLGVREFRSPTTGRTFSRLGLGKLVVRLGHLPARAGALLVVASLVIFAGGALVEDHLTLETDPERWVNQDSEVIGNIQTLQRETGSSGELGIFVRSGQPFSDETAAFIQRFAYRQLEERPRDLRTASSIVTTIGFVLEVPGASWLPPTGEDVAAAYEVAPRDIQLSTVNPDAGALNLIFRTGPGSLEERAVYTNEIREQVSPPAGIEATPSGLAVVGVGLLENLEANRILLTYLAIGFVLVLLTVVLRGLVRALLALVPVLIAVGLSSLGAWALGIKLSPMTAVTGPLVVAICTEFTCLILFRYLEERRRGLAPPEARDEATSRTGRAFAVSALTGIAGVAVIALSTLPLLRDFGVVIAVNVTAALLSALVILPPMLVWADRWGLVSRGMLRDQPDVIRHDEIAATRGSS